MGGHTLRNFVDGDEEEIVRLFNEVYGGLGGYVPRTVEYWRWCCLKRPDVRDDGIFLVFDEETGELEGYAVVGLSGNVWEFCSRPDREDVASVLLEKIINYLDEMGVSSVNLNVPGNDEVLNNACIKMGFAKVNVHKMFVGVLSFRRLISTLLKDKAEFLSRRFKERICIRVEDAPFWIEKAIYISVNDGGVKVLEGPMESPTILVKTDVKTLLSVLVGVLSLRRALLSLRIRVKPFWKILAVKSFLSHIRIDCSWYWPLGDFG